MLIQTKKLCRNFVINLTEVKKYSIQLMGCGSSQVAAVGSAEKTKIDEMPTEVINSEFEMDRIDETSETSTKYPPAEAFIIPLNDNEPIGIDDEQLPDESIIKKHPPKRLQRIADEEKNTAPTTITDLTEKLAKANIRRQQYLQQRVDTVLALAQPNKELSIISDVDATRSPGDGNEENEKSDIEK